MDITANEKETHQGYVIPAYQFYMGIKVQSFPKSSITHILAEFFLLLIAGTFK